MKRRLLVLALLSSLPLLALIVGYSRFLSEGTSPDEHLIGFETYREKILQRDSSDFSVIGVVDEGRVLRVNLALGTLPADRGDTRRVAMNALYEMRSRIGTSQVSLSVWVYGNRSAERSDLLGMAFHHALTGRQFFRYPEDLP